MNTKLMFSSKSGLWTTPQPLFDKWNKEFGFTLDPCCTIETAKCKTYFTETEDGLLQSWEGHTVFCNPPYGRQIKHWVKKAFIESLKDNTKVVMLLPARTCTTWFHNYIYFKSEIRFLRGRIKFGDSKNSAPFPSMLVIFH